MFIGAQVVRDTALPGSPLTPIFLRGLRCDSGTHSNILDCEMADLGITSCLHEDDVVVHCEGIHYREEKEVDSTHFSLRELLPPSKSASLVI